MGACCHNIICTDCAGRMDACPFARHSWDGTQQNQRVMPDSATQRLADAEQAYPGGWTAPYESVFDDFTMDLAARDNALAGVDAAAQRLFPEDEGLRQEFTDDLRDTINAGYYPIEEAEQMVLDDMAHPWGSPVADHPWWDSVSSESEPSS